MLKRFNKYIESKKLFNKNDKILLTVSGGVDSVVMLDLFIKSGLSFGIAHCNFNLRKPVHIAHIFYSNRLTYRPKFAKKCNLASPQ